MDGNLVILSKDAVAGMSDKLVLVPILVANDGMERPIICFNVIEELALTNDTSEDGISSGHMVKRLCTALDVGHRTARAVLSVLKKQKPESQPHLARVGRQPVTIPKEQSNGRTVWSAKQECGECITCSFRAKP